LPRPPSRGRLYCFGGLYEADPKAGACVADRGRLLGDAFQAQNLRRACRDKITGGGTGARHDRRLFAIEADIEGRSPAERVAARRERANPILDELRVFFDTTLAKISGKSDFAKAIRYAASRWTA
jgi:transposase